MFAVIRGKGGGDSKKIFVGGLATSVDDRMFRSYFESYGTIADAIVMMDRDSGRSRGFGFVTFDNAVCERNRRMYLHFVTVCSLLCFT